MAINYVVSYTFAPNTTISSSQVNTNFSDNANTWTGLEALTKTFAKLKVDVDPATALEVATKQYVDHYSTWRRPNLVYNSGTVVNIETGLNGTASQVQILFPDGNLRTDSVTGRVQCNLAQVAALSGSAQSGLRTGSAAANTWYAIYAVKTNDNTSNFVAVADTVFPIQANFATLNSNFGANSWVYIGMVANGDNAGHTTVILKFVQAGNKTSFYNHSSGAALDGQGPRLATTAGATSLGWSYAAGTSTAGNVPNNVTIGTFSFACTASTKIQIDSLGAGANVLFLTALSSTAYEVRVPDYALVDGVNMTPSGSTGMDIYLSAFVDSALGVGSNPSI